ncbi:ABC transporter ATP-binding protein [Gluconobacter kondonii]|uniref:ABC transporter ATP-binding protein n=1 Tax=Gluconobacter kondonii TaxID=941463 RepID=UPI001B8D2D72|nr:ABC transporter ATP-binding protein [Gluconobacter kondonii]MBS1066556.1 ABC transporter ATP-binding protein [Gluconobacter kondonii]MBS1081720.1 ABC transporter ATP-binding protein [Gluconobacter kondonii]MBS1083997.1 ABC transporter ATP-binding protein [Gluconobacter kondonii]
MSGLSGAPRMAPKQRSFRPKAVVQPVLDVVGLRAAIDAPPIDLSLQPGATLTLFGTQPAALSRLLDVLAGFLPHLGGTIAVSGEDVTSRPPAKRRMRIVSPRDPLFPHLDLRNNIALGLRANGKGRQDAQAAAGRVISLLGLDGIADRRPTELDAEQSLRVKLARALIASPDVLLLDDPLHALDPHAARRIPILLGTLSRALNLSIIHAVSRREDALRSGGAIAVFQDNVLLQCADAARLYDRPACVEVATLFGETNTLTGQVLDIGDDVAHIHLACGGIVDAMVSEDLSEGQECLVCVRPDRISPFFAPQSLGLDDDGDTPVRGVLTDSTHLGDHIRMRVRCAEGTEIELRRPPLQAQKIPASGTPVQLAWPAAHATAFPLSAGMY